MSMLLTVQSSPNLLDSASRAVSKSFIESYLLTHPGTEVVEVDLIRSQPSHICTDHLGAFFAPPQFHSAGNAAALAASEVYLDQLFAADVVVIGTPMHNLGIAGVLKSWIDNILRVGRTFKYNELGQPVGLLSPDKKVVVVIASGGIYSEGPMRELEFAGDYLKAVFGFMGVNDISVIRAEGMALGPDAAARGVAAATLAAQVSAGIVQSSVA